MQRTAQGTYRVVLMRHGESTWNLENRFTGWHDVQLTQKGVLEAYAAGKLLQEQGYHFDLAYSSVLQRAITTFNSCAEALQAHHIELIKSWRLNERHYGALQGLNKQETADKHGQDQVLIWRRSYDTCPPALEHTDPRFSGKDARYQDLPKEVLPLTECLKDTVIRCVPYWQDEIVKNVKRGRQVLVVAHGNSIRAIVKHLDQIADDKIVGVNIPNALPLVYELDSDMVPISSHYIVSPEEFKAKTESLKAELKNNASLAL